MSCVLFAPSQGADCGGHDIWMGWPAEEPRKHASASGGISSETCAMTKQSSHALRRVHLIAFTLGLPFVLVYHIYRITGLNHDVPGM